MSTLPNTTSDVQSGRTALRMLAETQYLPEYYLEIDFVAQAHTAYLGLTLAYDYLNIPVNVIVSKHHGQLPEADHVRGGIICLRVAAGFTEPQLMTTIYGARLPIVTGVSLLGPNLNDLTEIAALLRGESVTVYKRYFDEHGRVRTDPTIWAKLTLRSAELGGVDYVGFEALVLQCLDGNEPITRKQLLSRLVELCRLRFFSEQNPGSRDQELLLRELIRTGVDAIVTRPTINTKTVAGERVYRRLV